MSSGWMPSIVNDTVGVRRQEIECRGDPGDRFVILRTSLRPLRRPVGRGIELRERQRVEQLAAREQDACMRAVELVRRTGQKVAADLLHIDQVVRYEMDGIDKEKRASRACDRGD